MQVHRVVRLDDLRESEAMRIVLDGQPILLTKLGGEPHAISDTCPHAGASLSGGLLKDGCVTCPSHLWRFSLHDGSMQGSTTVQVPVYPTRLTADGWVEVETPVLPPPRSLRETLLAHARGEDVNTPT